MRWALLHSRKAHKSDMAAGTCWFKLEKKECSCCKSSLRFLGGSEEFRQDRLGEGKGYPDSQLKAVERENDSCTGRSYRSPGYRSC